MARRKRASMREGPLADLFRSTVEPEDPPEAPSAPGRESEAEAETTVYRDADEQRATSNEQLEPEPEPVVTEDEPVRAYRGGDSAVEAPAPRERLSRIFTDEGLDVDGPAYGREEPRPGTPPIGEVLPHAPVIRVVGVGGAGVNAINRMVEAQISGVEFMAINTDLQSLQ